MTEESTIDDLSADGLAELEAELAEVMSVVGEVLAEQGKADLASAVPWGGDRKKGSQEPDSSELVRLYSLAFQVLNIVEERVAMRTRREREKRYGITAERGLWGDTLDRLSQDGFSPEQIAQAMTRVEVAPVFTAHPTESKRPSMRERQLSVYQLLLRLENQSYTPMEKRLIKDRLKAEIQGMWMTGELHVTEPTVEHELRNALFYLRHSLPKASELTRRHLMATWEELGFDPQLLREAKGPKLQFGIWIGGDRDGHPLVTAEVTRDTLAELHSQAIKLHRAGLESAAQALSIAQISTSTINQAATGDSIEPDLAALAKLVGPVGRQIIARNPGEPFRAFAYAIRSALENELLDGAGYIKLLQKLDHHLRAIGGNLVADEHITPIFHTYEQFGLHLASLDVRQNSAFHDRAAAQLLATAGVEDGKNYADWSEERRREFLTTELESPRPFLHSNVSAGEEADAVRDCYRVLADHYHKFGARGLGTLIISMTRDLSDLLLVHLFAREAGLCVEGVLLPTCPLPVVPLLETLHDLDRGADIVGSYLDHPAVKRSLAAMAKPNEAPKQEVMLGYSDSCKDGGILASRVGLREAEHRIALAGRARGVTIGFFHGRGGSVSRGAGPMGAFVRSIPLSAAGGTFRMTEQGETIAQKYANLAAATHNLEIMLAAVTASHVRSAASETSTANSDIDSKFSATLRVLSDASQAAYRELLEADGFLEFYRQATPIDVLEGIRIGSRPSRRTGTASLNDLRAIPWVFSWTQARFNITGWYGVGSAFDHLKQEKPEEYARLKEEGCDTPFIKSLLYGVESSVTSANPEVMKDYANLVTDAALRDRFFDRIEAERLSTIKHLSNLLQGTLEERRPRFAATTAMREKPLADLHQLQIQLIRDWRANDGKLPTPLRLTVSAIASGLRATG